MRSTIAKWLGVGLLYAIGAVALTWPLALQPASGIALGTEKVATVPLFNLWTLAWNVESLGRGYEDYWQAPIFHPAPHTFALSEPQPLAGLIGALLSVLGGLGLGGSILGAYNVFLLLALTANGLLAAVTARVAGLGWLAAVAGGGLVLVLPFTHQELGVAQLVPLAGIFLFAIAGLRFAADPGPKNGLLLGAGLALAHVLSAQVAVFGALAAGPALLWLFAPRWRERRVWIGLASAAALFLVLVSPLILAQWRATSGEHLERSVETVRKQSAQPSHYLKSAWPMLVPTPGVETAERPSERAFWPGTLRVLLAFGALFVGWRRPEWRRLAVAGGLVLLTSLLFSMAAHLELGGFSFLGLLRTLPGLSQVRSFFRFALFAQLAIAGLVALALELGQRATEQRWSPRKALALVAAVSLLAIVEIRPTMGEIQALPPLDLEAGWIDWIDEHTAPSDVLAFVPFPEGRRTRDYLGTTQWMYWQMRHWRPMVNGYSGFFPSSFRELKEAMKTFPSQEALGALHQAEVRYCIVHRTVIESSAPPDPNGAVRLARLYQDEEHGIAIFELRLAPGPNRTAQP